MNASDSEVTRQIWKALVEDKTLSTYAQNVKIITRNSVVTLAGPVRSAGEKEKVMEKASWVVGTAQVINNLDVVSN